MPRRLAVSVAAAALAAACYATHHRSAISETLETGAATTLAVRLEVPAGEATVRPAAPGHLYDYGITYCRTHFAPRVSRRTEAGAASLDLGLKRRRRPGEPAAPGEERNLVDLALGADRPIDLSLDLGAGRHHADLGGLLLERLSILAEGGEVSVDFERPLEGELRVVAVQGALGMVRVRRLGNASPGLFTLAAGAGTYEIDLGGAWKRDAILRLDVRQGDVVLRAPRGLTLEIATGARDAEDLVLPEFDRMEPGRYARGPQHPGRPRVVVEAAAGLGTLEVILEG